MTKIWFAKETVCKLDLASNVTITNSAALDTFFGSSTAIEAVIKDLSLTEPITGAEKIDFQGTDTDGFQNAEMEEKPAKNGEISGTLVLAGDETVEAFFYDAGEAIAGTHTRYRAGKAAIRKLAFLLNLTDGTDEVSYALTDVYLTDKDTSIGGADSHYEITFTAVVLPRNFYGPEFLD